MGQISRGALVPTLHLPFSVWMDIVAETVFGVYLALFLSVVASILLYHFIERPIDKWRQSRFAKTQRAMIEGRLVQAA